MIRLARASARSASDQRRDKKKEECRRKQVLQNGKPGLTFEWQSNDLESRIALVATLPLL